MNQILVDEFVQQLMVNSAHVMCCDNAELPDQLTNFFEQQNLPKLLLSNLELANDIGIEIKRGRATGQEAVGLSRAVMAISETGTLILASSKQNPTSINFLVDHHLVLVEAKDIVKHLGEAMCQLKQMNGFSQRALNFISGPSRTADIEQTIQLGAHGPRNLWVFVLTN